MRIITKLLVWIYIYIGKREKKRKSAYVMIWLVMGRFERVEQTRAASECLDYARVVEWVRSKKLELIRVGGNPIEHVFFP